MIVSTHKCMIETSRSVKLLVNGDILYDIGSGSCVEAHVPFVSLGDKTVYAIEPQPDEIKVDNNWVHLIYKEES